MMRRRKSWRAALLGGALWLAWSGAAYASAGHEVPEGILWLGLILLAAKVGTLVERLHLPAVLGEILVGIGLGSLAFFGLPSMQGSSAATIIEFLAQLGAVILLFQIGLESNIHSMRRVGARSFWVATVGVVAPFVLGTVLVGPLLLPGLSSAAYLFIGASLTATSVGITGRVFRDMRCLSRPEAQIVLGAAVIDDVLGLIILSVVSAIATRGSIALEEIAAVTLQALGFLAGALVIGQIAARQFSRLFAMINTGPGMKVTVALGVCLLFAFLAGQIGLAPIVGAFAAGLILEEVHFRQFDQPSVNRELRAAVSDAEPKLRERIDVVLDKHAHHHLEHLMEPVGHLLVPVFFVVAGMHVRLEHLLDAKLVALAGVLTVVAVFGKLVAGVVAGRVDRWLVGWGMVPRGEVGLIFAFVGKSVGVVTDELFSVIVLMVMFTTLITPPVLAMLLRRERRVHAKLESGALR
jgi:Kef-type K+ transport system membrane component KefB